MFHKPHGSVPGNSGGKPTPDEIHLLVEHALDSGAQRYNFVQSEWFLETSMVEARARLRRSERSGTQKVTINMMDRKLAAAEILGEVANLAFPENKEGLLAIGAIKNKNGPSRTNRFKAAAEARECYGDTAARGWRQAHRRELIDLMTRELYRMLYFPFEDAVLAE